MSGGSEFMQIAYRDAVDFVLPRHYAGRVPQVSVAYGWIVDRELKAVCIFGKPASPSLCRGVCGNENSKYVFELNRLCRLDSWNQPLSKFVGYCLRDLKNRGDYIIISYADKAMNHTGYIYQATNFLYTGFTKERTDKYTEGNKHSRHYSNDKQGDVRKVRSSKHRYVYFCTKKKNLKKEWVKQLRYNVCPYPKTTNKNYILGTVISPRLVKLKIINNPATLCVGCEMANSHEADASGPAEWWCSIKNVYPEKDGCIRREGYEEYQDVVKAIRKARGEE